MTRISVRGILIENDEVILIHRKKTDENGIFKEYYVIPGGGLEEAETFEECLLREMKEELSIDIEVGNYLGVISMNDRIGHFFCCKRIGGTFELGGEEKNKNCVNNFYEIVKSNIMELDNYLIYDKEMILKEVYNEFK